MSPLTYAFEKWARNGDRAVPEDRAAGYDDAYSDADDPTFPTREERFNQQFAEFTAIRAEIARQGVFLDWDDDIAYVRGCIVRASNGKFYTSRVDDNEGNVPQSSPTQWERSVATGPQGPQGDVGNTGHTGPPGAQGATGSTGPRGANAEGYAGGGTTGQWVAKASDGDFDHVTFVGLPSGGANGDVLIWSTNATWGDFPDA